MTIETLSNSIEYGHTLLQDVADARKIANALESKNAHLTDELVILRDKVHALEAENALLRERLEQAERERDEISRSYYDCVALGTKYCNERDALRDQVETLREAAQRVESRIVAADSDTCQCESCVWLRKLRDALAATQPGAGQAK